MSAEPLNVYVVNYPLKYFAERIGGEQINVVFPAPTGIDPAYWIPAIPTIAAYQQADLILINGAGYAKWLDKVSLPRSKIVDTSKKFKDRYITIEGAVTHSHGPDGEHGHEGIAFTTWLDFSLAAEQAKAIITALSRKRPDLKDGFQKNYQKLEQDLLKLDQDLKTLISKDPSRPLVVSHPVYDYFARRYGLNTKSVHWEPDEIPTNEQMIELISILKEHPAQWMIWEAEPMKESVERLKAIGLDSLVFDPCENIPDQGDFLSVMRHNVENLKLVFK
jgi:zinc transport system substrate-binding protein